MLSLNVIQAKNGDCLLLSWTSNGQPINILIDGGPRAAYKHHIHKGELHRELTEIKSRGERINLLILTHVDDDHIGGILGACADGMLTKDLCDEVWFNSGKLIDETFNQNVDPSHLVRLSSLKECNETEAFTSISQGVSFEDFISKQGIWSRRLIQAGDEITLFGASFRILSPSKDKLEKLLVKWEKEVPDSLTSGAKKDYNSTIADLLTNDNFKPDTSIHNGSSIALLLELNDLKLLLLGDAHDDVVCNSIRELKDINGVNYSEQNPLNVNVIKLSHHASQYNTSSEFLTLIKSERFIISTDGSAHGLPNKLTLARIIRQFPNAEFHFNHKELINRMFREDEYNQLCASGISFNSSENIIYL